MEQISKHEAIYSSKNMQHFPFIGPDRALCALVGQYSPVWMEVSMQLVTPSDASGLSLIEMLLTVQGVVPVCGMFSFFQKEIVQPAACSGGEWLFFLCLQMLSFVCVGGCVLVCLRGAPTLCVCVWFLWMSGILSSDWLTIIYYFPSYMSNCALYCCTSWPPGTKCLQC